MWNDSPMGGVENKGQTSPFCLLYEQSSIEGKAEGSDFIPFSVSTALQFPFFSISTISHMGPLE